VAFAREAEALLVRDARHGLSLFNPRGELQGRCTLKELAAGCLADDGSVLAAIAGDRICWLALDLSIRWEKRIGGAGTAAALDPFGQYLAVADKKSQLYLYDRTGQLLGRFTAPLPIQHLSFLPTLPLLMAAAESSWVGCLDLTSGQWAWTDRPISQIGGLAVASGGDPMVLACFAPDLRGYGLGGSHRFTIHLPKPCGHVALTFTGEKGVAAGLGKECFGFNRRGEVIKTESLEQPPTALALSALGDRVICGFGDGRVTVQKWE
jgi:hypothetical protein